MVLTVYMGMPHLALIFHPGILGIPPLEAMEGSVRNKAYNLD